MVPMKDVPAPMNMKSRCSTTHLWFIDTRFSTALERRSRPHLLQCIDYDFSLIIPVEYEADMKQTYSWLARCFQLS